MPGTDIAYGGASNPTTCSSSQVSSSTCALSPPACLPASIPPSLSSSLPPSPPSSSLDSLILHFSGLCAMPDDH
eukprot:7175-Rhodomonas_salina.1